MTFRHASGVARFCIAAIGALSRAVPAGRLHFVTRRTLTVRNTERRVYYGRSPLARSPAMWIQWRLRPRAMPRQTHHDRMAAIKKIYLT